MTREKNLTHGYAEGYGTRIYHVWCAMLARCTNPKNQAYDNYGGRGITVCERWRKFENFLEDMGEPPEGLTIDRLDNDGPYCKDNCAWETRVVQANNRRSSVKLTFDGVTLTLREWSERTGIDYALMRGRYAQGWSLEKILRTPRDMSRINRKMLDIVKTT
jgi:hypothetical protein